MFYPAFRYGNTSYSANYLMGFNDYAACEKYARNYHKKDLICSMPPDSVPCVVNIEGEIVNSECQPVDLKI